MDWKKYPLALGQYTELIGVYPDGETVIIDRNVAIDDSDISILSLETYTELKAHNDIDSSMYYKFDVRSKHNCLDYIRDLYYSPDYDIAIVDSESFLELRYSDFESMDDVVKSESDLTHFSSKKIVTSEEQQCIEGMLHRIGIDATLSGYSKDEEYNIFIRYKTDEGKNLYIDYNLQAELVKELSLSNESINIDSDIPKNVKEKNDIDIEL